MKVLVINWRDIKNPEAGGAEIHIDEILKRKPSDWEVDFVSASFKNAPKREEINGYKVERIPNNYFFNYTFKKFWKKKYSKRNYDLVIDDISKIPLAAPKYIKNVPLIALNHHIHGKSLFSELNFPLALYVYMAEKHYLKYYKNTPIITVSESSKDDLLRNYKFNEISVINNGIELSQFYQSLKLNKFESPTLIYFGRLKKYKRVDHIIDAFQEILKHFPDANLLIAGRGDDVNRLQKKAAFVSKNNIKFLGFVADEEKATLLARSWISIIASEKEGWGIGVIESNAAGTPVVGYSAPGLIDSINNGYSGLLAKSGDIKDLSEKILYLLKNESDRNKLSQNAIEWSRNFSWDKAAKLFYEKIYFYLKIYKERGFNRILS